MKLNNKKTKIMALVPLCGHAVCFGTPWTVAHQVPLFMELSIQEYWSGLPFSPPGDLPELGIKPVSLVVSPAMAGCFFTSEPPGKPNPIISWEIEGD